MKGLPYRVKALVEKARTCAVLAVETYNRPTASFRSGVYIVLMIIAWTSLFHAIFLRRGIRPHYRRKNSRRYEKIDGERKWWKLKESLQQYYEGDNIAARKNLEFFIALRNKIEHGSLAQLDAEVFGECQAMLLNFESVLVSEFGDRYTIRGGLTFALQFSKVAPKGLSPQTAKGYGVAFKEVKRFVDDFRSTLSADVQSDLEYSFKVYLLPKIGSHASKDSVAVEWIKFDPSKPDEMSQYEKVVAMIKPKEVQIANLGLLKPGEVARQVAVKLGRPFAICHHALCYKHFEVRPLPGASDPRACNAQFCVYDDVHEDYCYKPAWVDFLAKELSNPGSYENIIGKRKVNAKLAEGRGAIP
ncbi:MAG: DUF3644 domain-containing protein [Candidatus Methylacidiphilaceae bacterium]